MRITGDGSLRFCPAHYWCGPTWPTFDFRPFRARIVLILEIEEADMAEGFGAEPANLKIILHHCERAAELIHGRCKKSALIIEARAPGEHTTNIEPFTVHLQKHIRGRDA